MRLNLEVLEDLTLYNTQVDDNTAASAGGGVFNSGTFTTSADVASSIFLNMLHAAKNEAGLNVWKLWVIKEPNFSW